MNNKSIENNDVRKQLIMLNNITIHNKMVRLEKEKNNLIDKENKVKENVDKIKVEVISTLEQKENKIKELEKEKSELLYEKDFYKSQLEHIPKFLLRIFNRKKLLGEKYE